MCCGMFINALKKRRISSPLFKDLTMGPKNLWRHIYNFVQYLQIWVPLAANFLNYREKGCCACESYLEWLKCIEEKTHIITSFQRFNDWAKKFMKTYLQFCTILANMGASGSQFYQLSGKRLLFVCGGAI